MPGNLFNPHSKTVDCSIFTNNYIATEQKVYALYAKSMW